MDLIWDECINSWMDLQTDIQIDIKPQIDSASETNSPKGIKTKSYMINRQMNRQIYKYLDVCTDKYIKRQKDK